MLDGIDLRELRGRELRANVSVLLQETLVFAGTVRENIAYGRDGATEDEIVAAAQAADADGFIRRLPQGYDTDIGQKGRLLSGGHDKAAVVWDVESGKAVQKLAGHTDLVTCAAFLPGGRQAVTSSYDKTLRLWNVRK